MLDDDWDNDISIECKACGHYVKNVDNKQNEFIRISGNFTIEHDDYHNTIEIISLYACPKCKTVRIQ